MKLIQLPDEMRDLLHQNQELRISLNNNGKLRKISGRVYIPEDPIQIPARRVRRYCCRASWAEKGYEGSVFLSCYSNDVGRLINEVILQLHAETVVEAEGRLFKGRVSCFTTDGSNLIFVDWEEAQDNCANIQAAI